MNTQCAPCPFCGGTDAYTSGDDYSNYVFCPNCEARGPHAGPDDASLIDAWNQRAWVSVGMLKSPHIPPDWIIIVAAGYWLIQKPDKLWYRVPINEIQATYSEVEERLITRLTGRSDV